MNVCVMGRRHPPRQPYSGTILCSFHPLVHAHATIHAPLRLAPQQYPLPPELCPSNFQRHWILSTAQLRRPSIFVSFGLSLIFSWLLAMVLVTVVPRNDPP